MRFPRSLARLLASTFLVAVVALGMSASAVFAAPSEPGRFDFGDSWCFQESTGTLYCFETDGFVQFVVKPDGDEYGVIKFTEHVVISEGGVVVGEYTTRSIDQSRYVDGALVTTQTVEHTNAEFDGRRCVFTTVFRMADYEIVVDHSVGPVCD